ARRREAPERAIELQARDDAEIRPAGTPLEQRVGLPVHAEDERQRIAAGDLAHEEREPAPVPVLGEDHEVAGPGSRLFLGSHRKANRDGTDLAEATLAARQEPER